MIIIGSSKSRSLEGTYKGEWNAATNTPVITSEPWIFSTDFGELYLKSFTGETYNVTLSLGV